MKKFVDILLAIAAVAGIFLAIGGVLLFITIFFREDQPADTMLMIYGVAAFISGISLLALSLLVEKIYIKPLKPPKWKERHWRLEIMAGLSLPAGLSLLGDKYYYLGFTILLLFPAALYLEHKNIRNQKAKKLSDQHEVLDELSRKMWDDR